MPDWLINEEEKNGPICSSLKGWTEGEVRACGIEP